MKCQIEALFFFFFFQIEYDRVCDAGKVIGSVSMNHPVDFSFFGDGL
jgi:hypothetical protein